MTLWEKIVFLVHFKCSNISIEDEAGISIFIFNYKNGIFLILDQYCPQEKTFYQIFKLFFWKENNLL